MKTTERHRYERLYWFLVINFPITLLIAVPYLNYLPNEVHIGEWLFTRIAFVSNFAFLYFDAPHAPYSYPQEFIHFTPSVNEIDFMNIDRKKDVTPFMNHYKNAIYFDDYVTGRIIDALRESELLETTIVLITGDHGAEFYERGFWGHNGAFSPEQVKVPLVPYLPGIEGKSVKTMTSHLDIPATLLNLVGCVTSPDHYSLGYPLNSLTQEHPKYVVSSSWAESAYIDRDATVVFSTETYNIATFEVRNGEYKLVEDTKSYLEPRLLDLTKVMSNMSKFLK